MPNRFSCPRFLSLDLYFKLVEQGWEWEQESKSFHFNVLCEENEMMGFDCYVEEEFPLKMTLYCMQSEFGESESNEGFNELGTEILAAERLLEITKPYLERAYDHGY